MAEEENVTVPEPTPTTETPAEPEVKSWRDEAGAKATFKQLKETTEKLAAIEAANKEAAETVQREKLEAQGKYEEIAKAETAKREALELSHAKSLTTMQLENQLIKEGLTEDYTRRGVIASYEGDANGVTEFVAKFKTDNAPLFQAPGMSPASTPAQGGASAGGANKSLEERLKAGDPAAQKETYEKLMAGTG